MDDDRPIQPDDRMARVQAGDLGAFVDLVRPLTGRLHRLAMIAAGERSAAERAVAGAIRSTWRDARVLRRAADVDARLARGLAAALPRSRQAGAGTPLDRALAPLRPADRVALARCLDDAPDDAALTVASRAGVETAARADGDIVDLDGPLAGWDLARLRSALASAAGSVDVEALIATIRPDLGNTVPEGEARVALRSALPGRTTAVRVAGLAVAVVVGASLLAWDTSAPESRGAAEQARIAPSPGTPSPGAGTGAAPDGADRAGSGSGSPGADTPGDFPVEVDGLPVLGVNAAKRLAADPSARGRAIAIRGWLTAPTIRDECATGVAPATPSADPLTREAAFCPRDAVLREVPGSEWGVAHLHPQLLPGTGLGRVARAFAVASGESIPAVVIAHYRDPLAQLCAVEGRHCGEDLVVDRIAWALGAPARPPTAVLPAASGAATRRSASDAAMIAEKVHAGLRVVAVTGVPTAKLGLVEPAAADVPSPSGFAWLVRGLVQPRRGDPVGAAITWLIIDDRTGGIVAAPDAAAGDASAPGAGFLFASQVDGALVRGVGDVLDPARAALP
jgi:hypothetical protein